MKRWERLKLVEYQKFFSRQPHWVWLTREGIDLIGLPYRVWGANALMLEHIYWVNQVRFYAQKRHPNAQWTSERDLKYEHEKKGHLPDAEIETDKGMVAIEVELTRKKPMRVALIMRNLLALYRGGTIWYFTTPATEHIVKTALAKFTKEQQQQFRIYAVEVTL